MTASENGNHGDQSQPELPRRFLRSFLLLALDRHDVSYGYELYEAVTSRGLSVDLAGVYRDLRTMERHDLVSSAWEPSEAGPDRRVYTLCSAGRSAALEAERELVGIRDGLAAALATFDVGQRSPA